VAPGGTRDEIEVKKLNGILDRCGIMKTEAKKGSSERVICSGCSKLIYMSSSV